MAKNRQVYYIKMQGRQLPVRAGGSRYALSEGNRQWQNTGVFIILKCKEGNYVEKGVGMLYLKAADNGKTQASLLF
jgi:hypothetical protein